jgi:hypothetical protein
MLLPSLLIDKIESIFPNERSNSKRKSRAYELISEIYEELQINENNTINNSALFQFPYSKNTLINRFYDKFYEGPFKLIKADPDDVHYDTAILQSDGIFERGVRSYHYRINPIYLHGELLEVKGISMLYPQNKTKVIKEKEEIIMQWHSEFMNRLLINEEYINHVTEYHYQFHYRTVYLKELEMNLYFVTKGTYEMNRLFLLLIKSKEAFIKHILSDPINEYFFFNRKIKRNKVLRMRYLLKEIKEKIQKGNHHNAIVVIYNDNLYVEKGINECLYSLRTSFQQNSTFHLKHLNRGVYPFRISPKNNRGFHQLTSLNKHYTNALEYTESKDRYLLSSLDLSNAQPTILANLINGNSIFINALRNSKRENLIYNLEKFLSYNGNFEKADEFLALCVSGNLYEALQEDYYKRERILLDRDFIKVEMLKVMFSKPGYHSPFINLNTRFKEFNKYLRELKMHMGYTQNKKNNLAYLLQQIEAFIFLDSIYHRMALHGIPGTTKHDCLIIPRDKDFKYIEQTQEIIKKVFDSICFKGICKLEHTVIKTFEYPNREEFIIDRWDDKQSEIIIQNYSNNPFFRGLK